MRRVCRSGPRHQIGLSRFQSRKRLSTIPGPALPLDLTSMGTSSCSYKAQCSYQKYAKPCFFLLSNFFLPNFNDETTQRLLVRLLDHKASENSALAHPTDQGDSALRESLADGVASWMASTDAFTCTAWLAHRHFIYDAAAAMVLAFAGTVLGLRGALVRPALALHAVLAVWCLTLVREHRRSVDRRKPKIRIHSYIAAAIVSADRGLIAHAAVAGTLSAPRKRISGKGQLRLPQRAERRAPPLRLYP